MFYVVSLVLVTSTISIMLFLQLPLALAADEETKLAVTGHAQGMTVFWGTVFTLTLVMMFAPSAFLLLKTARQYEKRSEKPEEVRACEDPVVRRFLDRQPEEDEDQASRFRQLMLGDEDA